MMAVSSEVYRAYQMRDLWCLFSLCDLSSGLELGPLVLQFLKEKNILLKGIAHPFMFDRNAEMLMPDYSSFDKYRILWVVPVYPGGVREALHRKLLLDYNDLKKLPFYDFIDKKLTEGPVGALRLRSNYEGEVANQELHPVVLSPKIPGRFYFLFGKPIKTKGREKELRDREKAPQVYLHVKSEVEKYMSYLKEKREKDPYRSLLSRIVYQATHGFNSEPPTFEL